jgi:hypothetical protein
MGEWWIGRVRLVDIKGENEDIDILLLWENTKMSFSNLQCLQECFS